MNIKSFAIFIVTLSFSGLAFAQGPETQPETQKAVPTTMPSASDIPATATPPTSPEDGLPVFSEKNPPKDEVTRENERYMKLIRDMEKAQQDKTEEDTLKLLKEELASRQTELAQIQQNLSQVVKKKTEDNENLKLLITLYESMKADEVAQLLKRMPMNLTVTIVKMMTPKKASKLIAAMDPVMAAQVSRLLIQIPQPQVAAKGENP